MFVKSVSTMARKRLGSRIAYFACKILPGNIERILSRPLQYGDAVLVNFEVAPNPTLKSFASNIPTDVGFVSNTLDLVAALSQKKQSMMKNTGIP